MLKINKIYNETCVKTMGKMPNNFIDLVVTSPPYDNLRDYKGYSFYFKGIATQLFRIIKKGGVLVWVSGDSTINGSETGTSFKQALYFKEVGFNLHDTMIYQKYGSGMPHKAHRYGQAFEYMFILSKGKPQHGELMRFPKTNKIGPTTRRHKDGSIKKGTYNIGGGVISNIWQYAGEIKQNHPAPFPEQLVQDHIISWSNEQDLIYDPFMGSGTTAKMAILNNRNYIGSEISEEYCKIANQRLSALSLQLNLGE